MAAVDLIRWMCNVCGIEVTMARYEQPLGWAAFTPVDLDDDQSEYQTGMHACHDCMGAMLHRSAQVSEPAAVWTQPEPVEVNGFADSTMEMADALAQAEHAADLSEWGVIRGLDTL